MQKVVAEEDVEHIHNATKLLVATVVVSLHDVVVQQPAGIEEDN